MRVCMLAYTFYESDNRVMRYAETLANRGDEVDVIALRQPGQAREEVLHGVRVFRIQTRVKNEKSKWSYFFRLLLFFLRSLVVLTGKHARNKYQVVHVHSMPDFLVFAAWLPRLTGAVILLDVHDLVPELFAAKFGAHEGDAIFRLLCLEEKVSTDFADHVIAPNHIWQGTLARSVPSEKCTVFLNCPDRAIFHRQGRSRQDGKLILLYPGTLGTHQGLDIAVRAFHKVKDEIPEAEFHIYGEGPAKEALASLIPELGLEHRVFLHSSLPIREIARIIEDADLGIVPKRSDTFGNEAFSTKTFEFMTMGVPIIVADTKVDRFYFNNQVVTFFSSGDVEDLAKRILTLARSPELRSRQSAQAEQFVQQYAWENKKHEYLQLLQQLMAQGSHPNDAESENLTTTRAN